jgi:hypothetical protein
MLPNSIVVISGIIVAIVLFAATGSGVVTPQGYTRIGEPPQIGRSIVQGVITNEPDRFRSLGMARRAEELDNLRLLAQPDDQAIAQPSPEAAGTSERDTGTAAAPAPPQPDAALAASPQQAGDSNGASETAAAQPAAPPTTAASVPAPAAPTLTAPDVTTPPPASALSKAPTEDTQAASPVTADAAAAPLNGAAAPPSPDADAVASSSGAPSLDEQRATTTPPSSLPDAATATPRPGEAAATQPNAATTTRAREATPAADAGQNSDVTASVPGASTAVTTQSSVDVTTPPNHAEASATISAPSDQSPADTQPRSDEHVAHSAAVLAHTASAKPSQTVTATAVPAQGKPSEKAKTHVRPLPRRTVSTSKHQPSSDHTQKPPATNQASTGYSSPNFFTTNSFPPFGFTPTSSNNWFNTGPQPRQGTRQN